MGLLGVAISFGASVTLAVYSTVSFYLFLEKYIIIPPEVLYY